MERQKVESSNIGAIGYDAASQTLEVEFKNGGIFQYDGVQPKQYVEMINAGSIGKYLHSNIKPNHKCSKIGEVEK